MRVRCCRVERCHHLCEDPRGRIAGSEPVRLIREARFFAVEQLHNQVREPTVDVEVMDLDDVLVAEPGGDQRFAAEPRPPRPGSRRTAGPAP